MSSECKGKLFRVEIYINGKLLFKAIAIYFPVFSAIILDMPLVVSPVIYELLMQCWDAIWGDDQTVEALSLENGNE